MSAVPAPAPAAVPAPPPAPDRRALLSLPGMRWLLAGSLVSMLGDQFTLVALPWLVLQLTGDPLAVGTVFAAIGLPRALLILAGGAVVDRHSPRTMLVVTKLANAVLLAVLAALASTGRAPLWSVGAVALGIGVVTAFSYPAGNALLPRVMPPAHLRGANGLLMGARQLTTLGGPLAAGLLVAGGRWPRAGAHASLAGLSAAFALDAASFVFSAWALTRLPAEAPLPARPRAPLWREVADALRALWQDVPLRTLVLYFAAVSVFVGGPLQVALPVLASRQLPGGAASMGALMSGQAAGLLAGMALAGWRPGWRWRTLGCTMLAIDAFAGLVFMPFGHIVAVWQGIALLLPLGTLGGFVQVAVLTWMQRRVAPERLGRTMSLFMFVMMGLTPLASTLAGAALRWVSPATLFAGCGAALLGIVAVGAVATPIRTIRDAVPAAAE